MSLLSLSDHTVDSVVNLPSGGRALLVHNLRSGGLRRANTFGD